MINNTNFIFCICLITIIILSTVTCGVVKDKQLKLYFRLRFQMEHYYNQDQKVGIDFAEIMFGNLKENPVKYNIREGTPIKVH